LAAAGAVVTVGLASQVASRRLRLGTLTPLSVLVPTLVLSKSAGAWIALVAGLLVLLFVNRQRIGARGIAAAATLLLAGLAVWLARGHPVGGLTGNIRWSYWRVALDDYRAHPALGSGAGSFGNYWSAHKTTRLGALDAHSLYVESLAELGPLGLALVLAFVATVLRAATARLTGLTAVAAAGFVTYAVHTGVDWDWELPAVTLAGVTLAGAVLVRANSDAGAKPIPVRLQLGLAASAVVLAVLTLVRLKTASG
jgi:O-antigen ligase